MFPCTSVSNIKDGQTTIVWFSLKLTSEPLSLPPPPPYIVTPNYTLNKWRQRGKRFEFVDWGQSFLSHGCHGLQKQLLGFAQSTEEGVNGAETCCMHDGTLGAHNASTPANNLAH